MTIPAYSNKIGTTSTRFESIPNHWQLMPCRAIVEEITEKNSDGTEQNYLSLMANVGVIKYEDKGDVGNKKPDDLTKCKIVRIGNLVINSMNYGIGSYGLSSFNGVCSPVYIVLNPIKGVLNERFALRIFEDKQFQSFAQSFGNGILAHRSAIGWDDLKQIEVPLPPLSEQTQIARFLDHETAKIDALIAEQKRLIKLLQEKRQAVISHAVTKGLDPHVPMKDSGVEWLGDVPAHWEVTPLKYICRFSGGGTPSKDNLEYWDGDIPWVSPKDMKSFWLSETIDKITSAAIDESSTALVEQGALLMVVRSGILQRAIPLAVNKVDVTLNQDMKALRFQVPNYHVYYSYLIKGFEGSWLLQLRKQGATVESIDQEHLEKSLVLVPPQAEIASIVEHLHSVNTQYEELIQRSLQSSELLRERRSALISAAVTGKIDVRDWQPPADEIAFDEDVRKAGLEASA